MSYEIFPMSPIAIASLTKKEKKYPYEKLLVGQSFIVKYGDCKHDTLVNSAYLAGKKQGKRFKVIDHGPQVGYEVAFIEFRTTAPANETEEEKFKRTLKR